MRIPLAGFRRGGFHKLDSLDSAKESSAPRPCFRKPLIMSRFFQNHAASGFRLDSPVKVPVASEMPRCAPPHTNGRGEEPCRGAGVATGPKRPVAWQSALRSGLFGVDIGKPHQISVGTPEQLKSVFAAGSYELRDTLPF